jgi:predicted carbohydrate-binding protein with CBM5 and CBM33 domain
VKLTRRLGAFAATAVLATGLAVAIAPPAAQAHGVTMFPGSRTFLCWQDGLRENGQIIPFNPACGAAVQSTGTTPLYNWFAVLRSDAGGQTTGYIPDGQLCSGGTGGPYDFTAYNAVRTDWPLTHLTSGASYQIRHSNWAAHPGGFRVSITPQGWNPNSALRWQDLTQIQFVQDPPASGGPGALNYYFWNLQMPTGRTGRAILYIQWIRSDSAENFFSCSDIVFDGGNGQVTGVGPNQTIPPTTSTATQTTTRPPSSTTRPPTTTTTTSTTTTPPTGGACTATLQIMSQWTGNFHAEVTVTAGSSNINGWTVRWTNPAGQAVSQLWNGIHTPSGQNSSVRNESYNGAISAGGSQKFGFLGTRSGSSPPALNSLTCSSP